MARSKADVEDFRLASEQYGAICRDYFVGAKTITATATFDADTCPKAAALPADSSCAEVTGERLGDAHNILRVHHRTETALDIWSELEEIAPASLYQTRRFLLPWLATIGAAHGIAPFLLSVESRNGLPLALLPLGIRKRQNINCLEFLGGKDSNSNLGLFRPGLLISATDISATFARAREVAEIKPDLAILRNQPACWNGRDNPFSLLPHRPSPSSAFACELAGDGEEYRKQVLSRDYRKKLRGKQRKLAEIGDLSFVQAAGAADAQRILDAFLEQKLQRFRDQNIASDFGSAHMRDFLVQTGVARAGEARSRLDLHALLCGNRIVATFGAGTHQGRFHGMFNSFDADPAIARFSPGDILLSHLIDEACASGLTSLDLGIGESRYKRIWCNKKLELFDTAIGFTARGKAMAQILTLSQRVKRSIKQNERAWSLAAKLRSLLPARR